MATSTDSVQPRLRAPVLACATLLVFYCTRLLVHVLGLLQPEIREGFYISLPTSTRRHRVREWMNASFPATFPVTYIPGVRVDAATYTRLRTKQLAPDTRGAAGCRLAHLNALRTISVRGPGWYLVVEDDVDGSFAHAASELRWLVALVPNLQALNLYSPTACALGRGYNEKDGRSFCRPLPIFNTRTTGYFVTPAGAFMMIETIERRPDLHVDEALAPIEPTLHWLLTFFLRGWVLADALGATGVASDVGGANRGKYDDDGSAHSRHEDRASMTRNDSHRNVSHRPLLPLHRHRTQPADPAPPALHSNPSASLAAVPRPRSSGSADRIESKRKEGAKHAGRSTTEQVARLAET